MDKQEIEKEKIRGEQAKKWQEECQKIEEEMKKQEAKSRKENETKKVLQFLAFLANQSKFIIKYKKWQ